MDFLDLFFKNFLIQFFFQFFNIFFSIFFLKIFFSKKSCYLMKYHLCSVSSSNTPVPLFSCRHFVFLERRFNLVTFLFAQALPCGNLFWDRLLVSLLWCSAFSLSHPDSLSVDETMHICCMAQAVASKSFGSVVLSALPSHAYLIPAWTPRYARALDYAVAR